MPTLKFEAQQGGGGGASDFDDLVGRPKYMGEEMTKDTNIPKVPDAVSELENDLDYADETYVDEKVAEEAETRAAADESLADDISAEAAARAAADTTITASVTAEAAARAAADEELAEDIADEATARAAADTAITASVTAEATARAAADEALADDIEAEETARETADTALGARIDSEATTRATADTALGARIDNIESRGRYLSSWNATTGLPGTEPETTPYVYKTGDYFIVSTVGTTNYKPNGAQYTGAASTTVETGDVNTNDTYLYDGTTWELIHTEIPEIAIDDELSTTSRNPVENKTITAAVNNKVDKVTGKQLSTNDYTTAEKNKLAGLSNYDDTEVKADIAALESGKVDKVTGKQLSTEDYTSSEKTKLAGIEAGAEVNDPNTVIDANYVHTDNNYTTAEQTKLAGLANTVLESTTGQSTTAGMTQKAITDALADASAIKVLTADDYNYPASNPNTIALWLLDNGIYSIANNVNFAESTTYSATGVASVIVSGQESGNKLIISHTASTNPPLRVAQTGSTGSAFDGYSTGIVGENRIIDNLTSTPTNRPLSANQGKVLKDLIDSLIIKGAGAPTTSTVGAVGQLYEDSTNGKLYQCTAVSGSTYTWTEVGGGGSGPTVVQTTGTSTTDVMSQKAASDMVYLNGAKDKIVIGQNAQNTNSWTGNITIGSGAQVWNGYAGTMAIGESAVAGGSSSTSGSVAIGRNAFTGASWSVAIGGQSRATVQGEFSVGSGTGTDLYNGTGYRLITNVHDPVSDHDAATKKYVDDHSGGGGPTVVQGIGTSTTDVMSQKAVTDIIFKDNDTSKIRIGNTGGVGIRGISIGDSASCNAQNGIAIGLNSNAPSSSISPIAIGTLSDASGQYSVAIGYGSTAAAKGEFSIGGYTLGTNGYNNTSYRLLTNVHDGVNAHDAVTKGQMDTAIAGAAANEINSQDWSDLWQ